MVTDVQSKKPIVGIFSEPNFLSLNILENLLSKKCSVKIFTSQVKLWQARTFHLANTSDLQILNQEKKSKELDNLTYAIFVSGFIEKENLYQEIKELSKYTLPANLKKILLFPFEKFESDKNFKIKTNDNLAIIYLGDLLGPRIDLESDLLAPSLLREVQNNLTFTVSIGESFYPVFVSDVARLIAKWLFSFGPYGRETFILGEEMSAKDFFGALTKYAPGSKLIYNTDGETRTVPRRFEIKRLPCNLSFVLSETVGWIFRASQVRSLDVRLKRKTVRHIVISEKAHYLLASSFGAFLLFASPFIILSFSIMFFFIAYKQFNSQKISGIQNSLLIAKSVAVIGREESSFLRHTPVLGRVYEESYFGGLLLGKSSDIALAALPLVSDSSEFFVKIMGTDIYDPQIYINRMSPNLDSVYQNTLFLEADTKTEAANGSMLAKIFLQRVDLVRIKQIFSQGRIILANLPNDLGKNGSKKYLVLFQNNMELRPTGGFIGSFGLLTFEGGRMTNFSISDVYSADGQLRGHVEPPSAIKNYLGEANWFLRDSNWDPDFGTSSKRAEWFLDKEVDEQVDGVVGIDLEVARRVLKVSGPMFLPDYNLDITDANLYEKTQAEAEQSFFPGSTRKASFLTALSRNLLAEMGKMDSKSRLLVLKTLLSDLEERHVQITLHDEATQNALSSIGWGGEVALPSCQQNCYPDFFGMVEANVGVNKANFFVDRRAILSVYTSDTSVRRVLTLTLSNSANPVLGNSGRYKVYLRILVPQDSKINDVSVISGSQKTGGNPEIYSVNNRKEVGTLVEILPGQTKQVVFNWESTPNLSFTVGGNYQIYVRKQAGVDSYPFTLTVNGSPIYNSTLVKDIWTQKH